jgi:signal transduction histidine kinase
MYKNPLIRAVFCLALILLANIIISGGLDKINVSLTNYLNAVENEVTVNDSLDSMVVINDIKFNNGILDFNIRADSNEYKLLIGSLTFYHEIYLNNELYSQNIDKDRKQFNRNFAYKTVDIKDMSNIRISGDKLEKLEFFIGKKDVMDSAIEKKTILYTVKLMSLFLLVMLFIIMYFHYNREKYFLVFILIAIISIVKSIALGELPVLASLFNVNIINYSIYDNTTTVLNIILPTFIMMELFEIKITKKRSKYIGILLLIIVIVLYIDYLKYFSAVFIVLFCVKTLITLYGAAYEKKYYKSVRLNGIMYFSFAVYKFNVLNGKFRTGVLNFYTNTAYVGAIFYLLVFAAIFLKKYLNGIKESKEIKKELERITLLRGLSHDLKLPLSVIKISSQMIESQKLSGGQIEEYASDITQEVNILEKMTDNINAYLKLGHNNRTVYKTSVESIFRRVGRDFTLLNQDNKFDFTVLYDKEDCYLNIDELELYRVLYNLVDNSFKYSNSNDRISISYKTEDRLIIIVEDTGVGMNSQNLDRIFSPFDRLDQSRNKDGMGLGLSVVKGIVDKYDGDISINSELGKGTCVTITI